MSIIILYNYMIFKLINSMNITNKAKLTQFLINHIVESLVFHDKVSLLNNYIEIGKYFAVMFENRTNYQKYEDINITVINNNIKEYIEGYISVKDQYEILKPLESYIL